MYEHVSDALKTPAIIHLQGNLYVARFETMKLYSTLAAVRILLEKKIIKPGDTLLDSSSGIYAYSLALVCLRYGLNCHIIASRSVDKALRVQLELLGVKVEGIDASPTLKMDQELRVNRCKEITAKEKNTHWMQQYHDDIHYAGYNEFTELIISELGRSNLTIVSAVGTGCSSGGLRTHFNNKKIDFTLHGIQPYGSVSFGGENVNDPGFVIAGIGSGIICKNIKHEFYDKIHWVSDSYSVNGCIALLRRYGVFAGLSSGACHVVANREEQINSKGPILFIAPDTGHRYVESVYQRYHEAENIDFLKPKIINRVEELALPWSEINWGRHKSPSNNQSIKESVI